MPSSPTLRQGSHVSSPSSTTSNSVLRGLPPYRQQEQIPDITLPEYGTIIKEDDDEELDGQSNNFYTAELTFSMPVSFLLHCQECTD